MLIGKNEQEQDDGPQIPHTDEARPRGLQQESAHPAGRQKWDIYTSISIEPNEAAPTIMAGAVCRALQAVAAAHSVQEKTKRRSANGACARCSRSHCALYAQKAAVPCVEEPL